MTDKTAELISAVEERGRAIALMEVSQTVSRLADVARARGFTGTYMDALEDVAKSLQAMIVPSAPEESK